MEIPVPCRILFVCLGNICRSPTAEAVMRKMLVDNGMADQVEVDSAGVGSWHVGEPADARTRRHAADRGYQLDGRARQVCPEDFVRFTWIVAMDDSNFNDLQMMDRRGRHGEKIVRMASFCTRTGATEVPDPYYGGAEGFETVLDIIEDACSGMISQLRQHQLQQG